MTLPRGNPATGTARSPQASGQRLPLPGAGAALCCEKLRRSPGRRSHMSGAALPLEDQLVPLSPALEEGSAAPRSAGASEPAVSHHSHLHCPVARGPRAAPAPAGAGTALCWRGLKRSPGRRSTPAGPPFHRKISLFRSARRLRGRLRGPIRQGQVTLPPPAIPTRAARCRRMLRWSPGQRSHMSGAALPQEDQPNPRGLASCGRAQAVPIGARRNSGPRRYGLWRVDVGWPRSGRGGSRDTCRAARTCAGRRNG